MAGKQRQFGTQNKSKATIMGMQKNDNGAKDVMSLTFSMREKLTQHNTYKQWGSESKRKSALFWT